MADLKPAFEEAGYSNVRTFIQSGNVVFATPERSAPKLAPAIVRMLSTRFGYDASVAVRSLAQMRAIVDAAPKGFGADPRKYRSDVIFLIPPLTSRAAIADAPVREGVDQVWPGKGV